MSNSILRSYKLQWNLKIREIERKINDLGPSHLAFTVKNLSENYKKLSQKGIEF